MKNIFYTFKMLEQRYNMMRHGRRESRSRFRERSDIQQSERPVWRLGRRQQSHWVRRVVDNPLSHPFLLDFCLLF